jgi:hypothetical protein
MMGAAGFVSVFVSVTSSSGKNLVWVFKKLLMSFIQARKANQKNDFFQNSITYIFICTFVNI